MDAAKLLAALPPEVQRAFASGALLYAVDGEHYAARRYAELGWWVWRCEPGSQEHFVDAALTRCTCPVEGECKHIRMLKRGGDTGSVPWPKRRLQKKRRHKERGER